MMCSTSISDSTGISAGNIDLATNITEQANEETDIAEEQDFETRFCSINDTDGMRAEQSKDSKEDSNGGK